MLETLILGFLNEADMHGYELKLRLSALASHYRKISDGSLYPALQRLLAAGRIEPAPSAGADARKRTTYRLTAAGREQLLATLARPGEHDISDRNRFFGLLNFLHYLPLGAQRAILRRRRHFLDHPQPFNPPAHSVPTLFRAGMLTMAHATRRAEIEWLEHALSTLGEEQETLQS
ncbi:PadR family transcriptional regulator [Paludibacterium yongneupense]|uniref:PadR family transcriptional regulator n=1 Tax=Paludibacterium yongneupense TaxID=400061 RepID=UPI00040AA8AE|nr:PadR family transcriptional regulator [Paludibacterium yongneupense]